MPEKRQRKYPDKTCPTCAKTFAKQGKFCSRACGNVRQFTPTYRAKVSNAIRTKMIDDPEFRQAAIAKILPDIPIPPQQPAPIGLDQFIADGDLWTEVD